MATDYLWQVYLNDRLMLRIRDKGTASVLTPTGR